MPSPKPKPVQAPFQQQQQQENTFAPISIAGTPEARALLDVPLDIETDFDVDPGIAGRTDLQLQESENRANSAFNTGVPRFARDLALAKEQREIRSQGAADMRQAQYMKKQLESGAKE